MLELFTYSYLLIYFSNSKNPNAGNTLRKYNKNKS